MSEVPGGVRAMKRWLWLRLTPAGRMEHAAARRYWRAAKRSATYREEWKP